MTVDINVDNQSEETMSPPPKTSVTAMELKERLRSLSFLGEYGSTESLPEDYIDRIAALIDAWVRVRELKAQYRESQW